MASSWRDLLHAPESLALALVFSAALTGTPAPAQTESAARRIDRAAKYYEGHDGFMGLVAVARGHRIVFARGYGYADLASKTPFTAHTRFRIGSLSKQFTAAAILLLQQDGKLKTTDLLSLYYPSAPPAWSTITLRDLLTHTSGIPDVDFGLVLKNSPRTPEELMMDIPHKPLDFPPGTRFEYANINYMLLGRVIERASGEPYCQFLQKRIFRPLRLTETGCDWNSLPVSQRAQGYLSSAAGRVRVGDNELSSLTGAGNLYSSARDLVRWTHALFGGKLLSPSSLTAMTTPVMDRYGYGLQIDEENGALDIFHNGVVDGFFSLLDYLPRTKTTVVVLSNLLGEGNRTNAGTLALDTEVVRLIMDGAAILPSEGKEAAVPETVLASYAGRYRWGDSQRSQVFLVMLKEGRLYISDERAKTDPERMMAETSTDFYLAQQEVQVTFDPHGAGSFEMFDFTSMSGAKFEREREPPAKAPEIGSGGDATQARE